MTRLRWLVALVVIAACVGALVWVTSRPTSAWAISNSQTFSGNQLGGDWSVYDSSGSGDPSLRDPSLVSVSDSTLNVATRGNQASGLCLCRLPTDDRRPYGRFDVRLRVTADATHGFAVLLWPDAENWPKGGEIDLAEFPDHTRQRVQFSVHYGAKNIQIHRNFVGDFTTWHTFRVDWLPSGISYYIDGKLLTSVTSAAAIPTGSMHVALQAGPDESGAASSGAVMQVQWVKSYRPVPAIR